MSILDELRKELQAEKDRIEKIWKTADERMKKILSDMSKERKGYDHFRLSYANYGADSAKLIDCPQCLREGKLPVYSLKATLENTQERVECPLCKGRGKCYFIWGHDNDLRDWKHDAVC